MANTGEGNTLLPADTVLRWGLGVLAAIAVALFIARAPTSFTGEIPLIGKFVPLKLNAIYVVALGPLLGLAGCIAIWALAGRTPTSRRSGALLVVFALVAVLSALLSLQYFLVLAPAELCASRPHFEFLRTDFHAHTQMTHCMSGTTEQNATAPYYFEPQYLQAWAQVVAPAAGILFLVLAWRRLA